MTWLRTLLENWLGVSQLRDAYIEATAECVRLRADADDYQDRMWALEALADTRGQQLQDALDRVDNLLTQKAIIEARIAQAESERWSAVAALTGGLEMLQQDWLEQAQEWQMQSTKSQLTRKHVNQLGHLKNTVKRQFGIHPSQAKKSLEEVLGKEAVGALLQG